MCERVWRAEWKLQLLSICICVCDVSKWGWEISRHIHESTEQWGRQECFVRKESLHKYTHTNMQVHISWVFLLTTKLPLIPCQLIFFSSLNRKYYKCYSPALHYLTWPWPCFLKRFKKSKIKMLCFNFFFSIAVFSHIPTWYSFKIMKFHLDGLSSAVEIQLWSLMKPMKTNFCS